jgi:hypothetical protein
LAEEEEEEEAAEEEVWHHAPSLCLRHTLASQWRGRERALSKIMRPYGSLSRLSSAIFSLFRSQLYCCFTAALLLL